MSIRPHLLAGQIIELLQTSMNLSWSPAGRVGPGTHAGKVHDGHGDSDILALVDSSWEDTLLIGSLPKLLLTVLEEQGHVPSELRERILQGTAPLSVAQARAALAGTTPGLWRLTGGARVSVEDNTLEISGSFQVLAGDPAAPTSVARLYVSDLASVANAQVIVEGHWLLGALLECLPED